MANGQWCLISQPWTGSTRYVQSAMQVRGSASGASAAFGTTAAHTARSSQIGISNRHGCDAYECPDTITPVEFSGEAERYCSLIEQAASFERDEFAVELVVSLAALIGLGVRLPWPEPIDDDLLPDKPSNEERLQRYRDVGRTLGDWKDYWTTFEPYEELEGDPFQHSVDDDLVEIWSQLKRGLLALEDGAAPDDVVWDWRWHFYAIGGWGHAATNALRALHGWLEEQGGHSVTSHEA